MRMENPGYTTWTRTSGREQLEVYWYERGKRRRAKQGTYPGKYAAEKAGKQWIAKVLSGEAVPPTANTVDGWLDLWLDLGVVVGRRPRTMYDYRSKLALYVRPAVGHLKLQELEAVQLDAVYAAMHARGLAPSTIRKTHAIMRKALGDARRKGLVPVNVADDASPPKPRAARGADREVWTADELRTFLDAIVGHQQQPILHTMAMTGLRRSEACALRWSALDLDAATLEVREGLTETPGEVHLDAPKTPRGWRPLDLDPETVEVLCAHQRAQLAEKQLVGVGYRDEGYVFARPDGQPWRPDSIGQAYRRIVARIGLPAIALHDLRHTHASLLLATGTEANVVADRLGHANAGFTLSTYGHSMPGRQADAVARVAALVNRPKLTPELTPEDVSSTGRRGAHLR